MTQSIEKTDSKVGNRASKIGANFLYKDKLKAQQEKEC
jgi:hypothetical protein